MKLYECTVLHVEIFQVFSSIVAAGLDCLNFSSRISQVDYSTVHLFADRLSMTLMGQRHEALALICTRGDLGASFPCFANTLWGVQSSFEPPKGFLEGLSGVPTPPQKVFWTFWKTIEILRHIAAQGLRFMAVQSPHFCVQACQHKICLCCIGLYWHSVRCGKFG